MEKVKECIWLYFKPSLQIIVTAKKKSNVYIPSFFLFFWHVFYSMSASVCEFEKEGEEENQFEKEEVITTQRGGADDDKVTTAVFRSAASSLSPTNKIINIFTVTNPNLKKLPRSCCRCTISGNHSLIYLPCSCTSLSIRGNRSRNPINNGWLGSGRKQTSSVSPAAEEFQPVLVHNDYYPDPSSSTPAEFASVN